MIIDIDEADVTILEENLNKSKLLIGDISSRLKKISNVSHRSEVIIKPMVDTSKRLEHYQKNAKDSLRIIDRVQNSAAKISEYEKYITNTNMLESNLPGYLVYLKKCKNFLIEMKLLKIEEFRGIFENIHRVISIGEDNLIQYVHKQIKTNSHSFDPAVYLNQGQDFPQLSEDVVNNLAQIIQFFTDYSDGNEDFMEIENVYIEQRKAFIKETLKHLEKATHPVFRGQNIPYEKNSNGINVYTNALSSFLLSENDLIIKIFSRITYPNQKKMIVVIKNAARKTKIFDKIFQSIFTNYIALVNEIVEFVNKNYSTDSILTFELIQCYIRMTPTLEKVGTTTTNVFTQLEKIFQNVTAIASNLFKDYLKFIDNKIANHMNLIPSDHGVSEPTVELMSRLRKFSEFRDASLYIVGSMKPGEWIGTPKPQWLSVFSSVISNATVEDEKKFLLSSYFSDCIDAIMINLEIKAKQLLPKKLSTTGFFLITNLALVEQVVKKSEMQNLLGTVGNERLDKLRKRFLNFFLVNWKGLAGNLMDTTIISATNKSKISSKDKDTLKEKLKNFNSEFDELVKSFKQYNIKDQQLKRYLVKEISFIIPLYNRFYEKYTTGEFAKITSKHIKYDKAKLASIIQGL